MAGSTLVFAFSLTQNVAFYAQYLGQMEEEGQASMEDEETTPTLPLLCLPERVLFPGETLPMHIYSPHVRIALYYANAVYSEILLTATCLRGILGLQELN